MYLSAYRPASRANVISDAGTPSIPLPRSLITRVPYVLSFVYLDIFLECSSIADMSSDP